MEEGVSTYLAKNLQPWKKLKVDLFIICMINLKLSKLKISPSLNRDKENRGRVRDMRVYLFICVFFQNF